jgi:hypothetical protein
VKVTTLKAMTFVVPPVHCELCRTEHATHGALCEPCHFDHQASEFEGVELTREDLQVEAVLGSRR